ncbi:MAG: fibronectin type III domain-containing protein [Thermoleophilia bacterium]|nr:fibronectin type III domain-containing protein [Thermoleophilia bacterium]
MTRRTRIALASSAAALAIACPAAADPTAPVLKTGPEFATGTSITPAWTPSTFSSHSTGRHYELRAADTTTSSTVKVDVPADQQRRTLGGVENGHRYVLSVRAVERECLLVSPAPGGGCALYSPSETASAYSWREVRMDQTDPTGSVSINGGAQYATSRNVTLQLAATDPPSAGGPASGVEGVQISQDATFACQLLGDTSECPLPFANSRAHTLDEGPDGGRTVRVRYRDAAAAYDPGGLVFAPASGNASAVASDTITLDRSQPTPVVTTDVPSADAGVPVAFSAASSTDATSGVNTASARWDFGDGTAPVNALQLNKSFANPGTHTGSLTIKDKAGNTNTRPFSFTVTGAPAPDGGGVTVTDPGSAATPDPGTAATPGATLTDPIRGAKRLNRAVQGKKLRIRVRLANRIQVRVQILRVNRGGRTVVRRQVRTAGPGFAVFTFTAPKAGRHVVRIRAGADSLTFPMGIARR